jgi:hypothetical protein
MALCHRISHTAGILLGGDLSELGFGIWDLVFIIYIVSVMSTIEEFFDGASLFKRHSNEFVASEENGEKEETKRMKIETTTLDSPQRTGSEGIYIYCLYFFNDK